MTVAYKTQLTVEFRNENDNAVHAICCAIMSVNRFPHSKPLLLQEWVANIGRDGFTPSNRSVLCCDHFEEKWFDGAVLTVFSLPTHFTKSMPEYGRPSVERCQ